MPAYIKDISYTIPSFVVTNEDLVKEFPTWNVDKITEKIGISERHVVTQDETALDLAIEAAESLFKNNVAKKEEIDFVIYCTQSPDYKLPSSACIIQDKLGLSTRCGAFDYNLGCSGYVYGLAIAKGFVESGVASNVLLLTGETYTKYIHPKDKGNRSIFGDGASATVVSNDGFAEIGNFVLGTDGSGADSLIVKTGGSRYPVSRNDLTFTDKGTPVSSDHLQMDGQEIFAFTLIRVPKMLKEVLRVNQIEKEDVDLFVFHQANKYMLDNLQRKLKIENDRFFVDYEKVGNTVSSTIPIALCHARKQGVLKGNVMLAGFGVGLSWAAVNLKVDGSFVI